MKALKKDEVKKELTEQDRNLLSKEEPAPEELGGYVSEDKKDEVIGL